MLADVGDEQSIAQSLSTFSSHMVNIVGILGEADDETLILFDELGAGTDPSRAQPLAAAIIEAPGRWEPWWPPPPLRRAEGVRHDHAGGGERLLRVQRGLLAPTYRLLIGIPGKSNAFAISERLGLPKSIIQKAAARIDAGERALRGRAHPTGRAAPGDGAGERGRRPAPAGDGETAKASREYKAKMEAERAKAVEKAQAEARAILDEARDTADQVFKELNDMRRRQRKEEDWQRVNDEAGRPAPQPQRGGGEAGGPAGEPASPPTPASPGGRHGGAGEDGHPGHRPVGQQGRLLQLQAGDSEDHRQAGGGARGRGETQQSAKRWWPGREHKPRTLGASPEVDLRV